MNELQYTAQHLLDARGYRDVFGVLDGPSDEQEDLVKKTYRRLARIVHPDVCSASDQRLAEQAFEKLNELHAAAKSSIGQDHPTAKTPAMVIRTKRAEHSVERLAYSGDICDLFASTTTAGTKSQVSLVKLARTAADADLMKAEADALKRLQGKDGEAKFYPFFPELIDTFAYADGSIKRHGNVLERLDGWYSLEDVRRAYPSGIHPLHMVWIWRRLLWLLGYSHSRGLIHGAVLPAHIMIHPTGHGVKLIDWCYSTSRVDESALFEPIKAIAPSYKTWCPPEVLNQESPSFGTDIYLAVRSMAYLMGGDGETALLDSNIPKGIRAFFKGSSQDNQRFRPQDAWQLLGEFDELLERMGHPFWPRQFRPFTMPNA